MIQNINPVLLHLGPLQIRYYGLIYMTGFLLFYFFFLKLVSKKILPPSIKREDIEQFLFYLVIWTVVGSRLFEVLFYSTSYFIAHPLKVFAIWEGGLSFHGGLCGVILYSLYFCKKKKIRTILWLDYCSIPAALALCLGRIANFINGELYGLPVIDQVTPPWYAVKFMRTDPEQLYRIPTQLLESISNLIIFIVLIVTWKIIRKKYQGKTEGLLGMIFLMLYGLFRFIVEIWKDYKRDIFLGMTTGQLLCLPLIIIGFIGIIFSIRKIKAKI